MLLSLVLKGGLPRGQKQTPVLPDAVDAVDADYILQGLGVYGLRRPRRVGWCLLAVSGDQDLAMDAMN